jgi:hypothetical protein
VTAGLLLAAGLSVAPAGAAVTSSAAKAAPAHSAAPQTLSSCLVGVSNAYEFYTWCKGTSPTSFRTIAYCADGKAVMGAEYADGSGSLSYADCTMQGLASTLDANWGILYCSNVNGTGTYAGYHDTSGDISLLLANWGSPSGDITSGGTALCQYSIGEAAVISETTPASATS